MAVITAAVTAVAAAIATTTAATVATAVVAVSTAIGVTGLAVGAIGMAIGNEDLMFAGKIMGYVGLAGGLAGGVIGGVGNIMNATGTFTQGFADAFAGASQHLADGWNKGVGSWFSGGDKVTGAIGSVDDVAAAAPTGPASSPGLTASGEPMAAFPQVAPSPTAISTPVNQGVSAAAPSVSAVPTAPAVSTPVASTVATPTVAAAPVAGATPAAEGGLLSSVSNMPDWMKYSMMTSGGQAVAGLAGGYFQGASAEEQNRILQEQQARDEAQRQLLNKQGNQVPALNFKNQGMVRV